MHQPVFFSVLFSCILATNVHAQYEGLSHLPNLSMKVFFSTGYEHRASTISHRVEKAMTYYQNMLGIKPSVVLLVLTESDWPKFTKFPVYGMPHYNDNETLIVAAEDNAFWKSFIPALDKLPGELSQQVQTVYKTKDGQLSMEAFFDLLALHELGHAFHFQGKLNMQRKWMGELFVNILLHTYIAEQEPGSLDALTLFPRMVINGGTKEFPFTTLQDVHARYDEIGKRYPNNYGWYQSRWHAGAGEIYDSEGIMVCKRLWDAFKSKKEELNDEELLPFLENASKAVAVFIRDWDKNTVR
jgi:hypothetical protein